MKSVAVSGSEDFAVLSYKADVTEYFDADDEVFKKLDIPFHVEVSIESNFIELDLDNNPYAAATLQSATVKMYSDDEDHTVNKTFILGDDGGVINWVQQ